MNPLDIISTVIALIAMVLSFLSWRDKSHAKQQEQAKDSDEQLRDELILLRNELKALERELNDRIEKLGKVSVRNITLIKILEERINNEIKFTSTLIEKLEKKLDEIESELK